MGWNNDWTDWNDWKTDENDDWTFEFHSLFKKILNGINERLKWLNGLKR